ncbi:ABC transporter ATP-binding protein [Actinomyces sp. 2119]|nr:ABC transporter ATP-binding protein [Actinomyces sp. 2119]
MGRRVPGQQPGSESSSSRRCPGQPDSHPDLRARYLLASWCQSLGLPQRRVDELLETVGLSTLEGRRVGQLSLGMRQRLALAMALAPQPRLLVLDEPTNGLDPLGIRWINSVIIDFAAHGGAVLLSSHHLSQLDHLAQRVLLIDAGRLITDEPMHDFKLSAGPLTHRVACSRASDLQEQLVRRGAHVLRTSDDECAQVRSTPIPAVLW